MARPSTILHVGETIVGKNGEALLDLVVKWNLLGKPPIYGDGTVADLPSNATVGAWAYVTGLRVFNGAGTQETAGNGTGGLVTYNGTNWVVAGTNVTAVA